MAVQDLVYSSRTVFPDVPLDAVDYLIGKSVQAIQCPAAFVDVAHVKHNCRLMLDATKRLGLDFRAHVKTHKTVQLARLQVGEDCEDIRLIASTVAEIESFVPWLLDSRAQGRSVNVLYGLPVSASSITRLAKIATTLGPGTIGVFIDHPAQIEALDTEEVARQWPNNTVPVYVKIDVGTHRAGVLSRSQQMKIVALALSASSHLDLGGFYAHMGHSYAGSSSEEATSSLVDELEQLQSAARAFLSYAEAGQTAFRSSKQLVLTLGASPTATATQNLLGNDSAARHFKQRLQAIKQHFSVEIHAGVYPVLDMQQLATRARPRALSHEQSRALLSTANLALRIMVEVSSIYDDRNGEAEALIAAGSIALGREPCKSYPGWGVVAPWPETHLQTYDPDGERSGWIVDRISQEHGVLRWHGSKEHFWPLHYGQKLMVWPNHACMAGPNFSFYAVVDSDKDDPGCIVDVWPRCRGW